MPRKLVLGSAILGLLTACDSPPEAMGRPALGDAGFMDVDAGVDAEAPRMGPSYAVLSSDYTASSISILDHEGNVVADDYIHSGSTSAGLVTTLSGGVTLPSRSGEHGVLVILDRFMSDVITRIRLSDGAILGQVKAHTPPAEGAQGGYSSNPQDYVLIDEHTAWVSRYEPNLDPAPAPIDRGTDLLRIDPSTMQRTDERIDLSAFDTTGARVDPDTQQEEEVKIFARPSLMVRVGEQLVVGLSRLAFDFSAIAEGAVALVDLPTRSAQAIALPGLANCSDVSKIADRDDAVLVSCAGFWQDAEGESTAGLAILGVREGTATIEHIWRASEHPGAQIAVNYPVSLGGTRVGAIEVGDALATPSTPDAFVVVDLASGAQSELFRIQSAFTIGAGTYDPQRRLLLVPDASVDANGKPTAGIRRFSLDEGGALHELPLVSVAVSTTLPVREVRPL